MKRRIFLPVLIIILTITACQLPGKTTKSNGSVSGAAKDYLYIFAAGGKSINLTVALDKSHAAEGAITTKGGQLKAQGADGSAYVLDFPADALAADTKVRMTPVASVSGLPFGGKQAYAVQLEPEGLVLYKDVLLTITPPQAIALEKQILFDYHGDGQGLGLAIPVKDSQEVKIHLLHFSGYGLTEGTPAEVGAVSEQMGSDPASRLESLTAQSIAELRRSQENGNAVDAAAVSKLMTDLTDQYEEEVVKPALESAQTSCTAGKAAIAKVIMLERQRQLLGLPGGRPAAEIMDLVSQVSVVCVKEEYQKCVDQNIINRMIPLYVGLMRQHELMDSGSPEPPEVKLARDLTVKCLTFELQFHSEGKFDTGDGGYTSTVDGKVTLRLDPASFKIKGSGPLENLAFEFKPPKGGKGMKCTVDPKTGGSTFEARSLEYIEDKHSESDPEYYVRDYNLLYYPGVTSESYAVHCILTDSQGKQTKQDYSAPPSGYWSGIYFTLHQDELNGKGGGASSSLGGAPAALDISALMAAMLSNAAGGGADVAAIPALPAPSVPADGGFFLDNWDVNMGGDLLATREWIKDLGGVGITESGTFKLLHRPGS